MKRHGHLIERIADVDNIIAAHYAARKHKTWQRQVMAVDATIEARARVLSQTILRGKYQTSPYRVTTRNERGKDREIYCLPYWPDRVAQHAICQVTGPIWLGQMIRNTYSSLPGRGVHDASRRLAADLRRDPEGTAWCAKCDVTKFYPSIDHDLMFSAVARKIKCPATLELLNGIIRSADVSAPGVGLPIGNYLSQWLANLFLSGIDHDLYPIAAGYHRYCDDIVILADSSGRAHALRTQLDLQLGILRLRMRRDWRVFESASGIDFAGYVHRPSHVLLRKRIKQRMARQLATGRANRSERARRQAKRSAPAYRGWVLHGDTNHLRHKLVDVWTEDQP